MLIRRVLVTLLVVAAAPAAPSLTHPLPAPVEAWIWQVDPVLLPAARDTYVDLLRAYPEDAVIVVAVEDAATAGFAERTLGIGPDPRVRYVSTGTSITGWARDRYLITGRVAILPAESAIEANRRGDLFVPCAASPLLQLRIAPSRVAFEGGNVILTPSRAFVGPRVARINTPTELDAFERALGRDLIVLGGDTEPPPHDHIDMYVAIVDEKQAVVGDPLMFLDRLEHETTQAALTGLGSFTTVIQEAYAPAYEAAAAQLRRLGYAVHRVPALHADDGEVLLTWTNAVVDRRGHRLRAYVPCYGVPDYDRAAFGVWKRLGTQPYAIRARHLIREGGAVRCLTNTVR